MTHSLNTEHLEISMANSCNCGRTNNSYSLEIPTSTSFSSKHGNNLVITEVIENYMFSVNIATLSETRQFLVIDRKPGADIWCLLSMGEECWNPVQTKSPAMGFLPQSNLCCVHDILPVFFNIPFPWYCQVGLTSKS